MASAGVRNDPLRQVSELGFSCQLRKRYPRQQAAASIQRLRPQERSQENRLVTQPVRPSPDRRSRLHSESPVVRSRGPRHLTVGAGLNRPPETFPDEPCPVRTDARLDESPIETRIRFVDCSGQHLLQEGPGCAQGRYHLRREPFPLLILQRPNKPGHSLVVSANTTGSMLDLLGCWKPAGRLSPGVAFADMG